MALPILNEYAARVIASLEGAAPAAQAHGLPHYLNIKFQGLFDEIHLSR